MARRKSPYDGFPRMPPPPKQIRLPMLPHHREYVEYDGDVDDKYVKRAEFEEERERREEERESAYYVSPEGIAERKKKSDRKDMFRIEMFKVWIIRPFEMVTYLFNRLSGHPYEPIGIGHIFSVALWIVIILSSIEIYLSWAIPPKFNEYGVTLFILILMLIVVTFLYSRVKAWWKVR